MFFGAFVSVIIDSALFEVFEAKVFRYSISFTNEIIIKIGESPFFATVFGVCLMTIGGLILWRVAPDRGERMSRWRCLVSTFVHYMFQIPCWEKILRTQVFVFSSLVFVSGISCFLLEKVARIAISTAVFDPCHILPSLFQTPWCSPSLTYPPSHRFPPSVIVSAGYVASLPQPSFLSTRSWCKPRSYYYCYHHHHHHLHHHHYHHYLHDIININMCIIYIIIDILWSLLSLLLLAVHGRTQRWVGNEHKMNT